MPAGIAQLVEQRTENPCVGSSNLPPGIPQTPTTRGFCFVLTPILAGSVGDRFRNSYRIPTGKPSYSLPFSLPLMSRIE